MLEVNGNGTNALLSNFDFKRFYNLLLSGYFANYIDSSKNGMLKLAQ